MRRAPDQSRLDEDGLRALLRALHSDEIQAARSYEQLRQKLILFFVGRGSPEPEELADQVLDRLSEKMKRGQAVDDLRSYAYGVARVVLMESRRRKRRRLALLTRIMPPSTSPTVAEPDARMECLHACAARLAPRDRQLVLAYYRDEGQEAQESRRAMAEGLGISPANLRLRMFRLRSTLERCTARCLEPGTGRRP